MKLETLPGSKQEHRRSRPACMSTSLFGAFTVHYLLQFYKIPIGVLFGEELKMTTDCSTVNDGDSLLCVCQLRVSTDVKA